MVVEVGPQWLIVEQVDLASKLAYPKLEEGAIPSLEVLEEHQRAAATRAVLGV